MDHLTSCLSSVISKCYGSNNISNDSLLYGEEIGTDLSEFDSIAITFEPKKPESVLLEAQILKNAGNEFFAAAQLDKALDAYSKALKLFERCSTDTDPKTLQVDGVELLASLLANRAAANLRKFDYRKCQYDANLAIKFKPTYEKAWARKAESLFGLRLFDLASKAYQMAASLVNDPYLLNRVIKCQVHIEHENQGLEVHQLLPGRDICINPSMLFAPIRSMVWEKVAIPLRNLIYLIVNKDTREAVVIDAAWDVDGIVSYTKKHRINIVAALITHWHSDHIG